MIVYKSAGHLNNYIVTLEIDIDQPNNLNRSGLTDPKHAKYRCKSAKVLAIERKKNGQPAISIKSAYDNNFVYTIGETVVEEDYTENPQVVCGKGIHFFLTKDQAKFWRYIVDGEYMTWYCNGALWTKSYYENNRLNGPSIKYYIDGTKYRECTFKDGKKHGKYTTYYKNGNVCTKCMYDNGMREGPIEKFYENGYVKERYAFRDGSIHGEFEKWHSNGRKWSEGAYECGKKHGWFKGWGIDGKLQAKTCFYKDSIVRSTKEWGEKKAADMLIYHSIL